MPASSGTPTSANSKKPKAPTPASSAASETITLTGVPVSTSSEPACAAKATGSRSCDGERPSRSANNTVTGRSAATAPLTLISAVNPATSSMVRTTSRVRLSPTASISRWPAQAVTPVASSASLTTNSEAMKITVGSPKPASASSSSRTSVAHSDSATPTATIATGRRSQTKITTTAARMTKVIVESLMARSAALRSLQTRPRRHSRAVTRGLRRCRASRARWRPGGPSAAA